jgi:hypothetical protein
MKSIFFIYFDLRKYSYIDKNFIHNEQFHILSKMHQLIESEVIGIDGAIYRLHLDNAVYFFPKSVNKSILNKLITIKDKVDSYFKSIDTPSTLHISCVYGEHSKGNISLNDEKIFSIIGEVNNYLQQTIYVSESEEGKILFDKICIHESAANIIGDYKLSGEISVFGHNFYYV